MARLDDPTIRIDRPRPDFRDANPAPFGRAQGDLDTTRRLGTIEQRATDLKDRFRAHFDRHEESWVAREALELSARRTFPTLQHPRPKNHDPGHLVELMMSQARRNVHARAIRRLSTINTIKTGMQNAVIRNRPGQSPTQQREPANDLRQAQKIRNEGP